MGDDRDFMNRLFSENVTVDRFPTEMLDLVRPIDEFQPWPRNPRRHDIGVITQSLRTYGQVVPLLVQRSTGYIVAGNGRWRAMKMDGWSKAAYVVHDLTDQQAQKLLLMDNRAQELGHNDPGELLAILTELGEQDDLAATGYDMDDVSFLRDRLDRQNREDEEQHAQQRARAGGRITCPKCGHQWKTDGEVDG